MYFTKYIRLVKQPALAVANLVLTWFSMSWPCLPGLLHFPIIWLSRRLHSFVHGVGHFLNEAFGKSQLILPPAPHDAYHAKER
jgi:hypothetical protein